MSIEWNYNCKKRKIYHRLNTSPNFHLTAVHSTICYYSISTQGLFKSKTPTVRPESDLNKKPSLADIIDELKKAKQRMYEEEEKEREEKEKAGKESGGMCNNVLIKA